MRLFLLFSAPATLRSGETAEWVQAQAHEMIDRLSAVADAQLTPLRATDHFAHDHDWLLELQLHPARAADGVLEHPALREFVGDLRLVGGRPIVALAHDSIALTTPA